MLLDTLALTGHAFGPSLAILLVCLRDDVLLLQFLFLGGSGERRHGAAALLAAGRERQEAIEAARHVSTQ